METKQEAQTASTGPGSFCVPRAAIEALLESKATAYEICAYLVLARFTDESGQYSSASISAVNTYTGANKTKGGPVDKAIQRLKTIRAKGAKTMVSNGLTGKRHEMVAQSADLGPILYGRDDWHTGTGEVLPDGPTERSKVLHVLPNFGEEKDSRVWFGNALVTGFNGNKPLKALKNAGDVAARLLLALYVANDMETWGGVRPVGAGSGPWKHYEPVSKDIGLYGGARLVRAKDHGEVASIAKNISTDDKAYWDALAALKSSGLIYEVVLVLNRNGIASTFGSGGDYTKIPDDAEPFYELDCRSQHGYKPKGEEGIGWATANTAGALGHSVATEGGKFDGTYAAIVPSGYGAMITGIYRLRYRVSNPKNAGVRGAWAGIHQRNKEALELVNSIRAANKLQPVTATCEGKAPVSPIGGIVDKSQEIPF